MDFSKAFDIPHDLVIAKLADYRFDKEMLCYIYSYLKIRQHCVSVNSIKSSFEEIISEVPKEKVVGPVLFNNSFYFFILIASTQNFADNNTLSGFAKTIDNLINILESQSELEIDWFKDNHMIVNPGISSDNFRQTQRRSY